MGGNKPERWTQWPSGFATIIDPGLAISADELCGWLLYQSTTVAFCSTYAPTTTTPTPLPDPPSTLIPAFSIAALPASETPPTSSYGPISTTKPSLPSPIKLVGSVNVEWPSASCDGFKVNEKCIPWYYWLDLYNEAFPPPVSSKPQPSIVFQEPDFDIRGPSDWCYGFAINSSCLRMGDVLAMLGERLTRTSSALATATAIQNDPAPAPALGPHKSNSKFGFIAIPLIVILIAVISAYVFWRRRAMTEVSSAPSRPRRPIDPNPIANVAQLDGPPSPALEPNPPPSMRKNEPQGDGHLPDGMKIFDVNHTNKARQEEITRRSQEMEQGSGSVVRKEWWDKELLFRE